MPEVSVIIPTHNRPQLLPRAVASAQAAGKDVEVIVVDDASIDETAAVCRDLKGIKYVRLDRNQGVAGARNVGIMESTAAYIAFLDDDDLRLPGSLDVQIEALQADPKAGFACGAMVMADQDYHPTGKVFLPRQSGEEAFWALLELGFPVMPLCAVIRKECFLRVGLLNRWLSGVDDWDIFVRIAELYPVLVIDQPMGLYRRPTPSSAQGSSAQAEQLCRAARHQLQLLKLPRVVSVGSRERRAIRRRTKNRIADALLFSAVQRLASGEIWFVGANIAAALRLNPWRVVRPAAYKKLAQWLLVRNSSINT